jgi:hypothetical protein
MNTKLLKLASFLGHIQREVQGNVGTSVLPVPIERVQVDGLPIEYYVPQMRRELYMLSSCVKSKAATIGGVTFESYDDTLKWVSQYFHKDDWKCIMDMPALYSLVNTDDQGHKARLEEKSNSTKAGYTSAEQARLSLSLQSKIPENFGTEKTNKTDHPFGEVATYDKCCSSGSKLGFRASVENEIRRVEASTT